MLSIVTTIHVAMLSLFAHQHTPSLRHALLVLPSVAFSSTPRILLSRPGVTLGSLTQRREDA